MNGMHVHSSTLKVYCSLRIFKPNVTGKNKRTMTLAEDSMTALLDACRYASASQPATIAPKSAPQSTSINFNSGGIVTSAANQAVGKRNHESSNATETVAVAKKKKASADSKSKEGENEENRLARREKVSTTLYT
jgi:hypothetical protein